MHVLCNATLKRLPSRDGSPLPILGKQAGLLTCIGQQCSKSDSVPVLSLVFKESYVIPLFLLESCPYHMTKLACAWMRVHVDKSQVVLAEAILDKARASWPPNMWDSPAKMIRTDYLTLGLLRIQEWAQPKGTGRLRSQFLWT